jgi:hypothetical protein
VVAILLLSLIGGVSLFTWLQERKKERQWQNERFASSTLKLLSAAEADFRANDRDWNRVNDFWTGDVAGLYYTRPNTSPVGPEIQLIDRAIAEADAAPLKPLVPKPIPYRGYYFKVLNADESENPPEPYRQETDKTSGKVHHLRRFGFLAYPAEPGVSGNYMYMINENNSVFRAVDSMPHPTNWPTDAERSAHWSTAQ